MAMADPGFLVGEGGGRPTRFLPFRHAHVTRMMKIVCRNEETDPLEGGRARAGSAL